MKHFSYVQFNVDDLNKVLKVEGNLPMLFREILP